MTDAAEQHSDPQPARGRPSRIHETVTVQRKDQHGRMQTVELPITEVICERIRMGVPAAGACESVGLPEARYHAWRARGAADEKRGIESAYRDFREATQRAKAESMVVLVAEMRDHGKRDTRATEFMLKNRFPEHFKDRQRLEVAAADDDVPDEVARRAVLDAAERMRIEDGDVIDAEWEPGESSTELRARTAARRLTAGNGADEAEGNGADRE